MYRNIRNEHLVKLGLAWIENGLKIHERLSEFVKISSVEMSWNVISQRMGQAPDWDHLPWAEQWQSFLMVISCKICKWRFDTFRCSSVLSALGHQNACIFQLAPLLRGSRPKVTTASRLPRWNFTSWGKSVQLAGNGTEELLSDEQVKVVIVSKSVRMC